LTKFELMASHKFSFKKRIKSFSFAINGIIALVKKEHNARIHLVASLCVTILGFVLKISTAEWISIVIVIGLVIISELFNTAIEKLADLVDSNWNKQIGQVKDYSAGAGLISAIVSVIVGGLIFIPKILVLLK
jgi:diacylglycerol kinase (ATP)